MWRLILTILAMMLSTADAGARYSGSRSSGARTTRYIRRTTYVRTGGYRGGYYGGSSYVYVGGGYHTYVGGGEPGNPIVGAIVCGIICLICCAVICGKARHGDDDGYTDVEEQVVVEEHHDGGPVAYPPGY